MENKYILDDYKYNSVNIGYKELNDLAKTSAKKDEELFFRRVIINGVDKYITDDLLDVVKVYILLYYGLNEEFSNEFDSLLNNLVGCVKYNLDEKSSRYNHSYSKVINEMKDGIDYYDSLNKNNNNVIKSLNNLKDCLDFFETKYRFYLLENKYDKVSFDEYLENNINVVKEYILIKIKYMVYTNSCIINTNSILSFYPKGTDIGIAIKNKTCKEINMGFIKKCHERNNS